jgi:hypothetical protein
MGKSHRRARKHRTHGQPAKTRSGRKSTHIKKVGKFALINHRAHQKELRAAENEDVPMVDMDGVPLSRARRQFLKIQAAAEQSKALKMKAKLAGGLSKKARIRAARMQRQKLAAAAPPKPEGEAAPVLKLAAAAPTPGQIAFQNKVNAKEAARLLKVAANTPIPSRKMWKPGPSTPGQKLHGIVAKPNKPGEEKTVKERRRERTKMLKTKKLEEKKKKMGGGGMAGGKRSR